MSRHRDAAREDLARVAEALGTVAENRREEQRRLRDLEAELEGATRIVAALVRQAGGRVEVDPIDLTDDVVVSRVDDPATGRLVLEVRP